MVMTRITSYNVCYTKLLRQLHAGNVIRLWSTGLARGIDSKPYPSRSYTVPLTLKSDERVEFYFRVESRSFLQFPLRLSDVRTFRITSYNVCYTKLLRIACAGIQFHRGVITAIWADYGLDDVVFHDDLLAATRNNFV